MTVTNADIFSTSVTDFYERYSHTQFKYRVLN